MTTFAEVVRAAIPGADDSLCDYILWERTPYPVGVITAKSLYRAASRVWRAHKQGFQLCEHCDNVAEPHQYACRQCRAALKSMRNIRAN